MNQTSQRNIQIGSNCTVVHITVPFGKKKKLSPINQGNSHMKKRREQKKEGWDNYGRCRHFPR